MRINIRYRKNLKMSPGKLAAQASHAVIGLGVTDPRCSIIVFAVSDTQFKRLAAQIDGAYIHADLGLTEVPTGEKTCMAWIDPE